MMNKEDVIIGIIAVCLTITIMFVIRISADKGSEFAQRLIEFLNMKW